MDTAQVVNDSVNEWMLRILANRDGDFSDLRDEDLLLRLLISIVKKRQLIHAYRRNTAWKRGGRNLVVGEKNLEQIYDPRSLEFISELEWDEVLAMVLRHFKEKQSWIIQLILAGHTHKEIAIQSDLSLTAVKQVHRLFKAVAKTVLLEYDLPLHEV